MRLAALGVLLATGSALALAQNAPESLLPKGFDVPASRAPRAAPKPVASIAAKPVAPVAAKPVAAAPVASASPVTAAGAAPAAGADLPSPMPTHGGGLAGMFPNGIQSMADLERLSPDKLDEALGLKPKYDIPPGARRAMLRNGILAADEGGLPPFALAHQDPSLVRAALAGNGGKLVSRWGHILLRRALASRMDAPDGMDPADFVALRAALLGRMGEGDAARALVQDVDPAAYSPALVDAAFQAYVATADLTGMCPVQQQWPALRKDGQWQVLKAMCAAFAGNATGGFAQLDKLTFQGALPRIDMLLAQKYAGAAGKGRRAVKIEWGGVDGMDPLRYALVIGTGLTPPASLMQPTGGAFDSITALAPMAPLALRADAADRAGGVGILSSAAMVDLYGAIYADDSVGGDAADRALLLRDAYVGETPADRMKAMRKLWDGAGGPVQRWSRMALTAYAAARMPVGSVSGQDAADLIAAMLAAGLDANAMRWQGAVEPGSQGWALLVLAAPGSHGEADAGAINTFRGDDKSDRNHKSAMLLAGLAGLGRIAGTTRNDLSDKLEAPLDGNGRWVHAIDRAGEVGNPALVALLAGLGMQGSGWDRMTARHLFHIVSALNRVGLQAEARMIAAEAVARG
ncbi:MAG: hypothetical protein KGN34_07260 [Sphingomonadales bacterium]|nr:hypothetical protein [Sphingomonadales bacterium]